MNMGGGGGFVPLPAPNKEFFGFFFKEKSKNLF